MNYVSIKLKHFRGKYVYDAKKDINCLNQHKTHKKFKKGIAFLSILNLKHLYEKDTVSKGERQVMDRKQVSVAHIINKALVFVTQKSPRYC